MENKELRNILLENIKNELRDYAPIQRNLKKSRKLKFRPKDKSLQSICDEISYNRNKISQLLFYYCWLKHSLKYWTKQDIHDFWEYYQSKNNPRSHWPDSYRYKRVLWFKNHRNQGSITSTYEDYEKDQFEGWMFDLLKTYKIELSDEQFDELSEYLYKNI